MVASVGRANGVGLLEYHFSLIEAILTNRPFLLFTLAAWFLYALKCLQFIRGLLVRNEYYFLLPLANEKRVTVFRKFFTIHLSLLFPILFYAGIAGWIGIRHHWETHVWIILLFFLLVTTGGAWRSQFILTHPEKREIIIRTPFILFPEFSAYWLFPLRYLWNERKILLLGIKLFSCLVLYGLLTGDLADEGSHQMFVLFYSMPLLGHGVLIYILRNMEESKLGFYRNLPVTRMRRFLQYFYLYGVLLLPEISILLFGSPAQTGTGLKLLFIFFAYSLLMFMNSLLFIRIYKKLDYLKIVTGLFLAIFIAVLTRTLIVFSVFLFITSAIVFMKSYYQFEINGAASGTAV